MKQISEEVANANKVGGVARACLVGVEMNYQDTTLCI